MSERPLIGILITDALRRTRVREYASRCGARAIPVTKDDAHIPQCRGLIWDLAPVNETAPQRLREVRERSPVTPVLVYVRAEPGTGPILQRCTDLPLVRLQFQGSFLEERALLMAGVEWLLNADVRARLGRLVDALFGGLPPGAAQFVGLVSQRIRANQDAAPDPTVGEMARSLYVSERTLEQWCAAAKITAPKRTILWLWLLHLALAADGLGTTIEDAASHMGIEPKRLQERLGTLLPTPAALATTPAQQLDAVLHALAAECRLSADRLAAARASASQKAVPARRSLA